MPIYVYGCKACGAVEEHIQRFSDPPPTKCESCGGRLKKQVTSAAFQLKGGGWYKDGYASANAVPDKASSSAGAEAKGGEAKSSDAKGGEAKGKGAKKGSSSTGSASGTSGSSTSTAAE